MLYSISTSLIHTLYVYEYVYFLLIVFHCLEFFSTCVNIYVIIMYVYYCVSVCSYYVSIIICIRNYYEIKYS